MKEIAGVVDRELETSDLLETSTFSIASSAKAFKLLIAGLYSDKPRAIIRELCANAFDSHAMAGILDRPFKVQIPTPWDQTFSVRDYGVSLTHEQVMDLYTTMFKSTKEDTNSQVGKFGLGSKTPFAYTDSYSVTAVLDGEKRIYNAYLDDKSIPRISLIYREPSDEEQGVEVAFPVNTSDIQSFRFAAERVFMGFDTLPTHNISELKKPAVVSSGANWKMYEPSEYIQGLNVRQGCVIYPVDVQALANRDAFPVGDGLSRLPLIIDMPVGTVDITPDREKLSYDAVTRANLKAALENVFKDLCEGIQTIIDACETPHEATRVLNKNIASMANSDSLVKVMLKRLKYRNRSLKRSYYISNRNVNRLSKLGLNITRAVHKYGRGSRDKCALGTSIYDVDLWSRNSRSYTYESYSPVPLTVMYWTGDEPQDMKYIPDWIGQYSVKNYERTVIVIPNLEFGSYAHKRFQVLLGRRPDVEYIDVRTVDLTEIKNRISPRKPYTPPKLKSWTGYYESYSKEWTAKQLEDFTRAGGTVFYVKTSSGVTQLFGNEVSSIKFRDILSSLRRWDIIDFDDKDLLIIGIPKAMKAMLNNIPKEWRSLEDELAGMMEEFDEDSLIRYHQVLRDLNSLRSDGSISTGLFDWARYSELNMPLRRKLRRLSRDVESLDESYGCMMNGIVSVLFRVIKDSWFTEALNERLKQLGVYKVETSDLCETIISQYPMMGLMSGSPFYRDWTPNAKPKNAAVAATLDEYISIVDAKRAATESV